MTTTVLAIVNGKGGCGKTSCAANLAAVWAAQRRCVLAVDLDAQGNLAVDFGVEDTDAGLALSLAVQGGPAIDPVRDVRPGLDLVAGGTRTDQLAAALSAHRNPRDAILDVVKTLRATAASYELTVIDTAPAGGLIEDAALVAADWIVVPTKADDKSLLGLQRVSQRLGGLRDDGLPVGALAGVLLFAIPAAATRVRNQARRELLDAFGDQAVVFDAVIRASERGAIDQARNGLVAVEYADAASQLAKPYWEDPRAPRFAAGAHSLADDYRALADEILEHIHTHAVHAPGGLNMARLTESQLAGFRTGTQTPAGAPARTPRRPKEPPRDQRDEEPRAAQPVLPLPPEPRNPNSELGPVPSAPGRTEPHRKVGLTLPLDLGQRLRAFTQRGYALTDLVMVAYQHHRDELVAERRERGPRRLERRTAGRSSFTITLSAAERDALDALAHHLDTTRSHTVASLLERHLTAREPSNAAPEPAPATPRSTE
jgi:chromosome partitioning protein